MPIVPLEIPPGVVRTPTKASRSSNWREVNLIRWDNGIMRPVDGWQRVGMSGDSFASRIRQIHTWTDNNGIRWTAFLCESNMYVESGGVLHDITPEGGMVSPYSDLVAGGYGMDAYDEGLYGTPRSDRLEIRLVTNTYTIDNWGEDLLAMTSVDGRLLQWSPPDPGDPLPPAAQVENSPLGRFFSVTPERHVMIFGLDGTFNRFGWCSQENINDWNFASTLNTAGFFDIQPASPFVAGKYAGDGVVFFTANGKAHISRFIGLPNVYSNEELGTATVPMSHMSLCNTAIGMVWPSRSGFWNYNGASIVPIQCPVWDWIVSDFNEVYTRYEAYSVDIPSRSEMWWFFCSSGSQKNDRAVIYNYREGWWSQARIGRTCGVASTFEETAIMAHDTTVYQHEKATSYPDAPELPWAETFTMNLGDGSVDMMVYQILPDITGDASGLEFSLAVKNRRAQIAGSDGEVYTPRKKVKPNGYVDIRASGRDFRLRVDSTGTSISRWTLGQTLVDVRPRGKTTTVRR